MRLVSYQINQREREHIMRKDFMQFLIQIRNTGRLNADDTDWRIRSDIGEVTLDADSNNTGDRHQQQHQHDADNGDTNKTLSIEQCAAQVFLFYLAGFDTSASVASYTIFETARKPSVLARLCSEIDVTLDQHGGKLTYEAIGDMKYLELCVMGELLCGGSLVGEGVFLEFLMSVGVAMGGGYDCVFCLKVGSICQCGRNRYNANGKPEPENRKKARQHRQTQPIIHK